MSLTTLHQRLRMRPPIASALANAIQPGKANELSLLATVSTALEVEGCPQRPRCLLSTVSTQTTRTNGYLVYSTNDHPTRYSKAILDAIPKYISEGSPILDPFAGAWWDT